MSLAPGRQGQEQERPCLGPPLPTLPLPPTQVAPGQGSVPAPSQRGANHSYTPSRSAPGAGGGEHPGQWSLSPSWLQAFPRVEPGLSRAARSQERYALGRMGVSALPLTTGQSRLQFSAAAKPLESQLRWGPCEGGCLYSVLQNLGMRTPSWWNLNLSGRPSACFSGEAPWPLIHRFLPCSHLVLGKAPAPGFS